MTVLDALRAVLPKSLFTHLGEQPNAVDVPARIATLIRLREEESERLIGWVQLVLAGTFAILYLFSPRPLDAAMSTLMPDEIACDPWPFVRLKRETHNQ